eukprot:2196803-Lingulodinium_polyedra.AAC.1
MATLNLCPDAVWCHACQFWLPNAYEFEEHCEQKVHKRLAAGLPKQKPAEGPDPVEAILKR